jgi:hypothetical protein
MANGKDTKKSPQASYPAGVRPPVEKREAGPSFKARNG